MRPAVMFCDRLFSEEELADIVDVGVAVIPPVADRPVRRTL